MPSLNWIGKEAVLNHHREVPYRLLKCEGELSSGDPGSGNLLIEGDNLEGLKALLPYYKGKVQCIYIDPPYNTGEESWTYNDNVNSPQIRKWLGENVGSEILDRHDRWLCMMWPRLMLLRSFLNESGVIFVSIDDNEVHHMRTIMDGVFLPNNFIANLVWQRRTSPDSRLPLSTAHDHILMYARNKNLAVVNRIPLGGQRSKDYKNPDNDPRGEWASVDLTGQTGHATKEQLQPLSSINGNQIAPPKNRCWAISQSEFNELERSNRIWYGRSGNARPRRKRFLWEAELTSSWTWLPNTEVGHNQEATKELTALVPHEEDIDMNPKPTRLLKRLLTVGANEHSLILDSFAGSGTTGQAVHSLNLIGGSRKFILIEMIPKIAREVTAMRLRNSGVPFRYCTLGEPLFTPEGMISGEVTRARLAHHIWFTETGEPLPHEVPDSLTIGVHNGTSIALIEGPFTVKHLRALEPFEGRRVVYADSCRIEPERLQEENVIFKAVPYDVRDV